MYVYVDKKALYASRLAEDVIETYEKNTGKIIKNDEDLIKVVVFYEILIEFDKLDMDCVNVYSKIIKTQDTYKIIFDEEYANELKKSGMGNWNLFLGKMLGHIMLQSNDTFEKAEEGTIFYPDEKIMQEYHLEIIKKQKEEEIKKKELLSELDKDLDVSKGLSKRKRYKVKGRRIGNEQQ